MEHRALEHVEDSEGATRLRLLDQLAEMRRRRAQAQADFNHAGTHLKLIRLGEKICDRADQILEESEARFPDL